MTRPGAVADPAARDAARFTVDPWDPEYGMAAGDEPGRGALAESTAELDLDLERPADRWGPVDPDPAPPPPATVLFLDGVRRIDARVWLHGSVVRGGEAHGSRGAQPAPGIAASLAAGLVSCESIPAGQGTPGSSGGSPARAGTAGGSGGSSPRAGTAGGSGGSPPRAGTAKIIEVAVERGLFTAAADAADIAARQARYPVRLAAGSGPEQLSLALQQRLAAAEVQLAMAFRARCPDADDLLVVDGPLRGRTHLDRTVGYIKTHHASYLPERQAAVVGALASGQRTPVFTMGTSWRRHSWYLRLPGAPGVPWSGVVRLECSPDLPPAAAVRLADMTARLLPRLASVPHKDPRAPQNLVPIGGLERELRRRLGDQQLLYRALRAAAAG
jgi:hypothetical protein